MNASSPTTTERARKSQSVILRAMQEPGRQTAAATCMGVSESTVSRMKSEQLEQFCLLLAHLGLKVVAVAHSHQAGFALGESVAGPLLVLHIAVGEGKISRTVTKYLWHLFQEIGVRQCRFALSALAVDVVHQLQTGHGDWVDG